jgi:hypothetical protein
MSYASRTELCHAPPPRTCEQQTLPLKDPTRTLGLRLRVPASFFYAQEPVGEQSTLRLHHEESERFGVLLLFESLRHR